MSYVITDSQNYSDIAAAIRQKTGSANTYTPSQMSVAITNIPQSIPFDIDNDTDMNAVLVAANVGKCYRFTGTTGTYTNGDLYVVEESE